MNSLETADMADSAIEMARSEGSIKYRQTGRQFKPRTKHKLISRQDLGSQQRNRTMSLASDSEKIITPRW